METDAFAQVCYASMACAVMAFWVSVAIVRHLNAKTMKAK